MMSTGEFDRGSTFMSTGKSARLTPSAVRPQAEDRWLDALHNYADVRHHRPTSGNPRRPLLASVADQARLGPLTKRRARPGQLRRGRRATDIQQGESPP